MWLIRKQGTSLHESNCHIFADIYPIFMHTRVCAFAENLRKKIFSAFYGPPDFHTQRSLP